MNWSNRWNILYRGPLSSCNYGCDYCPFAKTKNTKAELEDDRIRLERFVEWTAQQTDQKIGILFTPWGEAMVHRYYQQALIDLSHMPNVYRVAVQTNLSAKVDFMAECNRDVAALWTTYHPTQVKFETFLSRCRDLDGIDARYSVGVVGFKDAEAEIAEMRAQLPEHIYLWLNAYKRDPNYYTPDDIDRFESIDPLFRNNTVYHPSLGKKCRAGSDSFTIDGEGDARRCHFVEEPPIGNIYKDGAAFAQKLTPKPCPNATCGCHIGYVNLEHLGLDQVYGEGLLERIPVG